MSFPLAASLSLHHCVCVLGFHEIITWTLASCPGPWAVSLTNWDAGIPCLASNTLASKKVWNSQIEFERNQRFKHGPNERERHEPSLCWICDLGLCARFGKKNHLIDQRHGSKEVCKTLCNNAVLPIQKIHALCEMKLTYQMCFACFARCGKILHHYRWLENNGKQWMNCFDFTFYTVIATWKKATFVCSFAAQPYNYLPLLRATPWQRGQHLGAGPGQAAKVQGRHRLSTHGQTAFWKKSGWHVLSKLLVFFVFKGTSIIMFVTIGPIEGSQRDLKWIGWIWRQDLWHCQRWPSIGILLGSPGSSTLRSLANMAEWSIARLHARFDWIQIACFLPK